MSRKAFQSGFSLTEVLMAAGILLVGFLLIAGTFPVGVKLTAVATERTIGVVAAEEAMAKIHLYGIDNPALLPFDRHVPYDGISVAQYRAQSDFISSSAFNQLKIRYPGIDTLDIVTNTFPALTTYFQYESLYPSTVLFDYSVPATPRIKTNPEDPQRYCWSALCRRLDQTATEIQVTIFVSRMAGQGATYPRFEYNRPMGTIPANPWKSNPYPTPVPVRLQTVVGSHIGGVQQGTSTRWNYYYPKLSLFDDPAEKAKAAYITKGAILLDDRFGRLMRVIDVRLPDPAVVADLGEITLFQPVDSDGNATVIDADGDGLLLVPGTVSVPTIPYSRWVWVVPPAMAASVVPDPTVPPKVAGRNPCVGVYQGQL